MQGLIIGRLGAVFTLTLLTTIVNAQKIFTDERDEQSYRTVTINDQIWLAENLKYNVDGSAYYKNDSITNAQYGRLYTWDAAMAACPSGWRLPSKKDFDELLAYYGGKSVAGRKLKSNSAQWRQERGDPQNEFGAEPAGGMIHFGWFFYVEEKAHFWTSTEISENRAEGIELDYRYDEVFGNYGYNKKTGFSVRCIKED